MALSALARPAQYQANAALRLLPGARCAGNAFVVSACVRVCQAYLLGGRVDRADLRTVAAFAE